MRKYHVPFALIVAALVAPGIVAAGDNVQVGDRIRFTDSVGGGGGGQYTVTNITRGGPTFETFCVQVGEKLDFIAAGFDVIGVGFATHPNNRPLTNATAWLYSNFRIGTLAGLVPGYIYNDEASATALQRAIWCGQGDIPTVPPGLATDLKNAADAAVANGFVNATVRVINIVFATSRNGHEQGDPAQDVLTLVPTPAAGALGLVGLLGAGWMRRRQA